MNLRISALLPIVAAFCLTMAAAGCAASGDTTGEEQMPPAQDSVAAAGPTRAELQQELDAMKTENIQLKEKVSQLERTNRDLLSKASDLEASIAAREQAARDKSAAEPKPAKRSYEGVTSAEDVRTYKSAVALVRKDKFREAAAKFEALLNSSVKEDYAPNCRHWLGLAYFGLKDYKAALEQFKQVFEFKFSTKKDDAQLMIAQCYEQLGDLKAAKAEYEKLVKTYPTSEYVKRAKKKVREL
ncbi:MAG TPA: tetratricopeptide repeat protein [Bacteroidota bacterium]|nr:tetratricopeptide repeat protein [Bacteroidota bacterium]